jgi:hypothetical protein
MFKRSILVVLRLVTSGAFLAAAIGPQMLGMAFSIFFELLFQRLQHLHEAGGQKALCCNDRGAGRHKTVEEFRKPRPPKRRTSPPEEWRPGPNP